MTAVLLLLAPAPSVAAASEDSARAAQARTKQLAARGLTRRLLRTSRRVCARRSPAACRRARARVKRARRHVRATKTASMRSRQAAPVVTVSNQTLNWSRVADVTQYVLATRVPGRPTAYQTVSGLSITPPAVPGATVAYSLRTDVRDSRWSADVSLSYAASGAMVSPSPSSTPTPTPTPTQTPTATPTPTPTPGTAAPVLTVSGETILWARVADVTSYVLATKVPGQPVAYRDVTGLSVTPPAVPGQSVTYGLRTNVAGSEWAAEVQIAYPATAARREWLGGVATWYGFNGTTEPERWQRLRAKLARFDAAASGNKAVTDEQLRTRFKLALDRGVRPYPVLYWDSGAAASSGYTPRMPTDADLDRFAAWMKEHQATVPEWELGNEVGFDYMKTADTMADDYARTAMVLARKMAAAGVTAKLVLNADLTGNGQFIAQMAAAEPTLGDRPEIGGFSIHPYGPRGPSGYNDAVCVEGMTNGCGWEPYIDQTIARIEASGWKVTVGQGAGQKPLHVTEWGFATTETWPGSGVGVDHMWNGDRISDGGFARPLNFGTKGDILYANIKAMYDRYGPAGSSRAGAISRFVIYKDVNNWPIGQRDAAGHAQREAFFGVLQHDGSALPGVTEKAQQALDLR